MSESIATGLNIVNHVSGRIKELKKLYNDIAMRKKSEMLIHQKLPNHMRRRAMSHNPKRIPYKYRQIHISQMSKSGLNKDNGIKKRPSRKYRRKPSNLLKEYNRRKQKNVWLETHIWHAKRFKIKNLWGYKIPFTPNDKRYRASYRAIKSHCLIQDISYYGCIEISGPIDELKRHFSRVIAKDVLPSITALCYINGSREGSADIFKIDKYPYNAISNIKFIWKPHNESDKKTIWIFSHPAAYQDILSELTLLFQVKLENNSTLSRNKKYENGDITLIELKDTLNRFRLSGSRSNFVLSKAFKVVDELQENWLEKLFNESQVYKEAHKKQKEIWKNLKNSSEFPIHCVLGLNIEDPRVNRSLTYDRNPQNNFHQNDLVETSPISGIWNKELRDNLIKSMMTNSELCKLRNQKQLVPTIASNLEKHLQPIPVLLIHQPGNERTSLGGGWDVIVPAGYGLSVWLNLIKFGAKSSGWKEYEMSMSEMGKSIFHPDSIIGRKEAIRNASISKEIYFLKPPNRRTNFRKISIASPFYCPFDQLIKEWNGNGDFYLVRNLTKLKEIDNVLKNSPKIFSNFEKLNLESNSLLPVKIHMISRGSPENNSIICLPNKKDIKFWMNTRNKHSKSPIISEKIINDPYENERKISKFNHKKELKRLRNRRVREKRKAQNYAEKFVKIAKANNEKLIREQFEKMCELWVPSKPTTIRYQCSREVFGYVTDSRFTLNVGKVSGIGFIASDGLIKLSQIFQKVKNIKPFVLIRSPHNTSYHVASISINIS